MFILLSNIKNTFVFYWGRFSVNEWFGVGFLELYFLKNIEGYHIRMYHLVIGWHTLEWTSFQNQMLHSHLVPLFVLITSKLGEIQWFHDFVGFLSP